jgi:23S rRNA pseudouridine2605 synthase
MDKKRRRPRINDKEKTSQKSGYATNAKFGSTKKNSEGRNALNFASKRSFTKNDDNGSRNFNRKNKEDKSSLEFRKPSAGFKSGTRKTGNFFSSKEDRFKKADTGDNFYRGERNSASGSLENKLVQRRRKGENFLEERKNQSRKPYYSAAISASGSKVKGQAYRKKPDNTPVEYSFQKKEQAKEGEIRLNRYIANAGVCSRREADQLIQQGLIEVNGQVVTELGTKVQQGDVIKYDGKVLKREAFVYVLLNKPKDFITTTDDPQDRKTVMSLVAGATKERIYPVGRLDRNTTGLLLLTNDGELTEKLAHPSNKVSKVYQVDLDKPITADDLEKLKKGVYLEDGFAEIDEVQVLSAKKDILGISLHIGKNRIVRRIFEHLGYTVVRLDRVMYAGLTKRNLPRGNWRYLTEKEVINLKYLNSKVI